MVHEAVRPGDVIGTGHWWTNRIFNFLYLWFRRDLDYAKRHWRRITPSSFWVVCRARRSDLLYASRARRKNGKADIEFKSLEKLGRIVFVGRNPVFDALITQKLLSEQISAAHYTFVTAYDRDEVEAVLYTGSLKNCWLNVKYVIYSLTVAGYKWLELAQHPYYKPRPLDIIELGKFENAV